MPTVKLVPTTIIGRRCISKWRLGDGRKVVLPLDPVEYDTLAQPGAGEPPGRPAPDAIWLSAVEKAVYDTPSGDLEPGCLVTKPEGFMVVTQDGDPHATRFLIDRSKHGISGSGGMLTVTGLSDITLTAGWVTF